MCVHVHITWNVGEQDQNKIPINKIIEILMKTQNLLSHFTDILHLHFTIKLNSSIYVLWYYMSMSMQYVMFFSHVFISKQSWIFKNQPLIIQFNITVQFWLASGCNGWCLRLPLLGAPGRQISSGGSFSTPALKQAQGSTTENNPPFLYK